jgi:hypothetical protein
MGLTGVGKSTLINMLVNNGTHQDQMRSPACTGNQMSGQTAVFTTYFNLAQRLYLTDSIGIGDNRFHEMRIHSLLKQITQSCWIGFQCVILVLKYGRLSSAARREIEAINVMLGSGWMSNSILVFTYSPRDATLASWKAENKMDEGTDQDLVPVFSQMKGIIFANNEIDCRPTVEQLNYADRKVGLERLQELIGQCDGSIRTSMEYFTWLRKLVYFFFVDPAKTVFEHIQDMKLDSPEEWRHNYGECAICLDGIYATNFENVAITPCQHCFHDGCLSSHLALNQHCPLCRKFIEQDEPDID